MKQPLLKGILTVLTLCAAPPGARPQEHLLTLGAPETIAKDVLFALPIDVALCPAGNLLIADMYDNVLTNVGRDGNVLWRAGAAGQGPGEFRRLYRVTCANDGTAIAYDIASQEISRFSPTGEFVERGRLDVRMAFVDRMVSLRNRKIAIAGIARNDHSIHVFDQQYKLVDSFGPLPHSNNPRALEHWGAGGMELDEDENLLFTLRVPYEIYRFSPDGEQLLKITAPFELRRGPDDNYVEIRTDTGYRISANPDFVVRPIPARDLGGGWLLSGRLVESQAMVWDLFHNGELAESRDAPNGWALMTVDRARSFLFVQGQNSEGDVEFSRLRYTLGPAR